MSHCLYTEILKIGYRYGKSLIPVSTEDEEAMKLSSMKQLSILGFTSIKNVWYKILILDINLILCSIF